MESMLLIVALSIFLLSLLTVSKIRRLNDKTEDKSGSGKEANSIKLSTDIAELKKRVNGLQNSIKSLKTKNRDIQRINVELGIEKTRLEETLEKLTEMQRKKDELFTMYLHDIKNPAATIKNMAGLFSQFDLTLDEQKEIVNALTITADKIVRITSEITKILTYEYSIDEIEFEIHSIQKVIEDVCSCNKQKAKLKGQELIIDFKTPLPDVEMEPEMIFDAIDNLLDNAIKFSNTDNKIQLVALHESNYISIQVLDNGPGIPLEDIEKAFRKGSRLTPKPTGGEISTGYGLWIVKKIVDAHRGKVWLKSEQNKGSNFGFKIPISQSKLLNGTA
ncbi:MAG: hypothetical protein K8H86_14480 [Ignavibacteriaceae bacterium]|nr:hypothetical protein [Ignavibacteriaceae bacterium]